MSLITAKQSLEEIKRDVFHALNRAGNDRKSGFRFVNFCTTGKFGPNARYVVLRKFDMVTASVLLYTDYRSRKISEIQVHPTVTILAHDAVKRVQVKMVGKATIHYHNDLSKTHWNMLASGQEAYLTKEPPGTRVQELSAAHQMEESITDQYFAVINVNILQLEVLQLNGEGHIRALFNMEESTQSFLVP